MRRVRGGMSAVPASRFSITGVGVLSAYGIGAAALMDGLSSGEPVTVKQVQGRLGPGEHWRAAEPELMAALGPEPRRGLNRESAMLLAAARLALADARLGDLSPERTGVVVSTRDAGLHDYAELYWAGVTGGPQRVRPTRGPQTGLNAPAAQLSIRLGAQGPNMTLSNGAAGGLDALAYACTALACKRADVMLVGGVDAMQRARAQSRPSGSRGESSGDPNATGAPLRCSEPAAVVARPFDEARCGTTAGEAAAVLVLERERTAKRRGAGTLARVGALASAFSPERDLAEASRRSLGAALQLGFTRADSLVGVLAGAGGSVSGDAAEALALHTTIGGRVPVCAVQGGVGDCGGALALVQVATAALALRRRTLPSTVGFRSRGRDLAPINVLGAPQRIARGPLAVNAWDRECYAASALVWDGDELAGGCHDAG